MHCEHMLAEHVYLLEYGYKTDEQPSLVYMLRLFPGVTLGLNDIHTSYIALAEEIPTRQYLCINYCESGRCEVKKDGHYIYVDSGSLSVDAGLAQEGFHYPQSLYRGVELYIELDTVKKCPCEALNALGLDPLLLENIYIRQGKGSLGKATAAVARYSDEIWACWKDSAMELSQKLSALRLLACQLLHLLLRNKAIDEDADYTASVLSRGQYQIVQECHSRITEDLGERFSIEQLASEYGISASSLKQYFSRVYGMSISEYLSWLRLKQAKHLLTHSDLSIQQIAASVGYENQSKFSAFFRKNTGISPLEFKRLNKRK